MLLKNGKAAQTFIAVQTKTSRTSREMELEIMKIDGVTLYLTAHPPNDGDFGCGKVNTFYKSYSTDKDTVPITPAPDTFEAYCLNITWTFNASLFESTSPIGFMLKLRAKLLTRKLELTETTPSFAIHGDRLMQFEKIEITYRNCTGVIVDWTIDQCQQPNGTLCLDPNPFAVNDSIWDMPELLLSRKANSDRVEWASRVDHQIKGAFWTNFFPQPAEGGFGSVVLSSPQKYERSLTYAVSVRVPDWIKETKRILLIPGMRTGIKKRSADPLTSATTFDYLIVKANVTATIVPYPDNYAWYGPWSIMRPINRIPPFSPHKNCQAFKDSQTLSPNCPDETIFDTYAGAEPGLNRLDEHHLVSGRADSLHVDSTSTATSVFTDEQCQFCLEFDMDRKETWPYSTMNRMFLFSMPYHPWVFDEEDKETFAMTLSSCLPLLGNTFGYPTNFMTSFTGEFEQLTGGNFTFRAYPTNSAENYCSSRSPTYEKSFTPTSADTMEFAFRGNCIASSFCPDLSLNESLGFMLKITEEPRTFQLDLQTPSFAIHGARLSTFFAIQISTNESVNFLIDITQNDCTNKRDNAGEEICDDLFPILIDDHSLAFVSRTKIPFGSMADNGTFRYFYTSHHRLENTLAFLIRHNPDVDFLEYGISIRAEEWVNENKSVLVIPGIENQDDDFYIMIQEDVIATVVDSPTADKETPWSPFISMKVSDTSQTTNDCPLFQDDLTCLTATIYSGVAGGDPGNSINQRHLLLNDTAENFLLYSTSTAVSISSNDQCSFCLHFDTRKPEQSDQGVSYLVLERFSIWTPPFYPWIHDTSEKIGYFQNSQFVIAGQLSNQTSQTTDMSDFKVRIKRLQGVAVTMFAYSGPDCLADNHTNDPTFHDSVNSTQTPEWSFQAKCIWLSWEPNKTYDEETGFLMEIQEVEKEKEKTKRKSLTCIWIASGVVTSVICVIICIVGCKSGLFTRLIRSKDAKRNERLGVFMNIYNRTKSTDQDRSKWEIDPSSLVVTSKKLGSGSFAAVYEGLLKEIPQSFDNFLRMKLDSKSSVNTETRVAVKMCHPHANREEKAEMLREIEFMIDLDVHSHLLCLLACSTDPLNPLIITEICEKGDLLSLLRKPKDEVFLTGKHVIHRDVAARNVLMTGNNLAKLADFGLCRRSTSLLYRAKGGRLPVKWMAPESLRTAEFTEKTDLWSFGVFLWELYTFGDSPYVSLDPADMFEHLKEGNRLEFPEDTPDEIKKISFQCWQFESIDRPDIQTISSLLYTNLETGDLRYGYLNFHKESGQQNVNERRNQLEMVD